MADLAQQLYLIREIYLHCQSAGPGQVVLSSVNTISTPKL